MVSNSRDKERRSVVDPPVASRRQLFVSGALLLLWILFLAWTAMGG